MKLEFIGLDNWDRPVYQDENGVLWKDVNPRKGFSPDLCTSVNNDFYGEPDTNMCAIEKYSDSKIIFIPKRITW